MSKPERLTHAAIAAALGLDRSRISQLAAQGMPTNSIEAAQAWREEHQSIAARKSVPKALADRIERPFPPLPPNAARAPVAVAAAELADDLGGEDFDSARTRRERAQADLAEIELLRQRGELISVAAVRAVWSQDLSATREHLLSLADRLAPVLAAENDLLRVGQILGDEIRGALEYLSGSNRRLNARSAAPDPDDDGGDEWEA